MQWKIASAEKERRGIPQNKKIDIGAEDNWPKSSKGRRKIGPYKGSGDQDVEME